MQRTIEEITEELSLPGVFGEEWETLLKELIETVAVLQREKCAEKAKININLNDKDVQTISIFSSTFGEITIDRESILNAKL